jgi:hypothetical protein
MVGGANAGYASSAQRGNLSAAVDPQTTNLPLVGPIGNGTGISVTNPSGPNPIVSLSHGDYVDLANAQAVGGLKTFSSEISTPSVLNVKTYGATGNGTTDDTSAIQSTITAAASSGATVFVPPGTYKVTSTLTGTNALHMVGVPNASILIGSGISTYNYLLKINYTAGQFYPTEDKGPTLEYLTFQPNNGVHGVGLFSTGYAGAAAAHATVKGCIIDCTQWSNSYPTLGLAISSGYGVRLDGNFIYTDSVIGQTTGLAITAATCTFVTSHHCDGFGAGLLSGVCKGTGTAVSSGSQTMTLTAATASPAPPGATGFNYNTALLQAIDIGTELLVGTGGTQETVSVTAITRGATPTITATFVNSHSGGVAVQTLTTQGTQVTASLIDAANFNIIGCGTIGDAYTTSTFDNSNETCIYYTNCDAVSFHANYIGCAAPAGSAVIEIDNGGNIQIVGNNVTNYNSGLVPLIIGRTAATTGVIYKGNTHNGTPLYAVSASTYATSGNMIVSNLFNASSSSAIQYVSATITAAFGSIPSLVVRDNQGLNNGLGVVALAPTPTLNTDYYNPLPFPIDLFVSGGTLTNIKVGGYNTASANTGLTAGTFRLEPGEKIQFVGTVLPTIITMAH